MATFGGKTFDEQRDGGRLLAQLSQVKDLMKDSKWRTLEEIEQTLSHPQASISARLIDLRKSRFGAHTVNREYVRKGLFRYQLVINATQTRAEEEVMTDRG